MPGMDSITMLTPLLVVLVLFAIIRIDGKPILDIAETAGKKVVFELPDAVEAAGFSKATKARLDSRKINKLGWKAAYDIKTGLERTITILKSLG